mmetsp:Transcript_7916/g.19415  ORF Transcript_7916/g.19415 Transcript_7916/m.19415 type:complete len:154 (+) Transcript_7916:115-576(+)
MKICNIEVDPKAFGAGVALTTFIVTQTMLTAATKTSSGLPYKTTSAILLQEAIKFSFAAAFWFNYDYKKKIKRRPSKLQSEGLYDVFGSGPDLCSSKFDRVHRHRHAGTPDIPGFQQFQDCHNGDSLSADPPKQRLNNHTVACGCPPLHIDGD